MRLAFFDDFVFGAVVGDNIVDLSRQVADIPRLQPQDLLEGVIEHWTELRPTLEAAATNSAGVPLTSVRLRPPVPRPGNIDCMAVNYMEYGTLPEAPPINGFPKSPDAVIGDGNTMVLPDVPATIFEGEAELALIIAKRGSNIPAADAMSYIFGYTNLIDGSARGLPPANNVFYQAKSRATFCPIGPYIVTADEVTDPQNLAIRLWNNGNLMQDFNSNDMAHKIPRCIEFVSSLHAIGPGDILTTGTNHQGLDAFLGGDKVELEVEGLGRLHISVEDSLNRTWDRETRRDRVAAGRQQADAKQLTGKYA